MPSLPVRIGTLRVGGAAIGRKSIARWLGFFEQVILPYGAREGGDHMTLREIDETTEILYTLRPGTEAQVLDEDGQVLPHSVPRRLRLRSPGTVSGYVGEPEANAQAFRDGRFYPGDLAMLTPDGRMKIIGRVNDQLNLGGVKLNAADIDEAAKSVTGVADAMCFTEEGETGAAELSVSVVRSSGSKRLWRRPCAEPAEPFSRSLRIRRIISSTHCP